MSLSYLRVSLSTYPDIGANGFIMSAAKQQYANVGSKDTVANNWDLEIPYLISQYDERGANNMSFMSFLRHFE